MLEALDAAHSLIRPHNLSDVNTNRNGDSALPHNLSQLSPPHQHSCNGQRSRR